MTANAIYVGKELDLFAKARHWKTYFRSQIAPYFGDTILEVGAGIGGTTKLLCQGKFERWVCLEPDPQLAGQLADAISQGDLPESCEIRKGTLETVPPNWLFDTILYIDVLEHIEDDKAEVARAAAHLKPGGYLIALSPAHQWLFTPFDASVGHYRRYSRREFASLHTNTQLKLVRLASLDSVGLLASTGNRLLLNSAMPTARQIALWDNWMVPCSRFLDPILGHFVGKSVVGIWQK